jgi:hypothetical protein
LLSVFTEARLEEYASPLTVLPIQSRSDSGEELIAVGIIDYQEPVSPRTLLNWNSLGFEFRAQRVHRSDRTLGPRWLDVQGNEHQPLAHLFRPRIGQDKRTAPLIDLSDAVLVIASGTRESEAVNLKAEREV